MNTAAMRTFSPAPAARTPAGALACHGYQEPHALPTGALRTCRGVVIGGAIAPALPRMASDDERIQAALLDDRTATPRPLWARIAGALWGAC